MPCIANYTAVISADCSTITLTDTSTSGYNGETINSRTIAFTDSLGNLSSANFPNVTGVGDIFTIPIPKDLIYEIVMTLVPSTIAVGSVYVSDQKIASYCNAIKYRDTIIKTELMTRDTKNVLALPDNLIQKLGAVNCYLIAVIEFTRTGDLVACQQALDLLTSLQLEAVNNAIS